MKMIAPAALIACLLSTTSVYAQMDINSAINQTEQNVNNSIAGGISRSLDRANQIQQQNQAAYRDRVQQNSQSGNSSGNGAGQSSQNSQNQQNGNSNLRGGGGADGGVGNGSGGGSSEQTTQSQMQREQDERDAERQHQQEQTQQKIKNAAEETYNNRQKSSDKNAKAILDSMTGAGPGGGQGEGGSGGGGNDPYFYDGPLFTYEDYLKMPKYSYNSTQRNEDIYFLYAPQGESASRGGASGYDAALNSSRYGCGLNCSLGGAQGSLGGIYPMLKEIYNAMREVNPAGAMELARMMSKAGAFSGIGKDGQLFVTFDPAIRDAIINGILFETPRNNQPGSSTGGFSNVALVLPLLFRIFDFGLEDGDNVTLTIRDNTGIRFTDTFNMTNAGRTIAPVVNPGRITLSVKANNEGSASPNTGQIDILSNVVSGNTTQQFNLRTGETGDMVIDARP